MTDGWELSTLNGELEASNVTATEAVKVCCGSADQLG
jgi:hypothetical protein